MTARSSYISQLVLVALALGYSLYLYPQMPDRVPTHWNINGQADGWGSKGTSLWLVPIMMIGMIGLTALLPKVSPKNYEIASFSKTYFLIMTMVSALFAVMHITIASASAHGQFDMMRIMMAAIFAFFAVMGNVMGKVRRNYFVGIRTPWTLSSPRVWDATHRQAGWLWFMGGIVGCLLALLGLPFAISIAYLMVLAFVPVVSSYLLYKRLEL